MAHEPPNRMSDHVSEDIMERYAVKKLPEAGAVEENLLVCHRCQGRVGGIDGFLADRHSASGPPQ